MAGSFPTSVTTYVNPGPTDTTATEIGTRTHDEFHADNNDDLEQVMTKLGTGASTASANTVLRGTGAGSTAFGQIATADIATSQITSALIADDTIVNADVNSAAAILVSKLAAGGTANRLVGTTDGSAMAMQQIVNAMVSSSAAIDPTKLGAVPFVFCQDTNNQSIGSGAETDITWATENEDPFGIHAASSASFVIPSGYGGIWVAAVIVKFAASSGGNMRTITLHNSPVSVVASHTNWPAPSETTYVSTMGVFRANATGSIRATAYQNSGAALNIIGATSTSFFFMARIGT